MAAAQTPIPSRPHPSTGAIALGPPAWRGLVVQAVRMRVAVVRRALTWGVDHVILAALPLLPPHLAVPLALVGMRRREDAERRRP